MKIEGQSLNILIDSGASSSHNSAAKVYAKILNNRIKDTVKELIGKNQYGFISKRSTKQAILRIDIKREHFTEHRKKGKLVMIDFSKAFNRISRSAIKEALKEARVSKKFILKILKLNKDSLFRVGCKIIYIPL